MNSADKELQRFQHRYPMWGRVKRLAVGTCVTLKRAVKRWLTIRLVVGKL
ncbi:MAG: hypothetical protein ACI9QL_002384 [Candidatus Omnitrophota bacterium]|jgi:hypothetical protein